MLFDTLTVTEHLQFFCKLKGVTGAEMERHVREILVDLQLEDKRDELSKNLSGGSVLWRGLKERKKIKQANCQPSNQTNRQTKEKKIMKGCCNSPWSGCCIFAYFDPLVFTLLFFLVSLHFSPHPHPPPHTYLSH